MTAPVAWTRQWLGIPEGEGPPWTDLAVAERLLGQFRSDLVGIVTGVNQHLRDVDDVRAFAVGTSTCETTHLIGQRCTGTNGGGACHERAAVVAAIAETVERYSATYRPDHAIIQASWQQLAARGDNAVSPGQLRLFTDAQLAEPGFPFVGFTDDLTISWVPGSDLASGERTWLPASLVFLTAPSREPAGRIGYGTSNGLAAGCTWDEAALSGLLELIERDGFCTAWHNGLSMPRIDPASDPEVSAFFDRHVRPAGLPVALVDLSGFCQVPSVLAVVRNEDNDIAPIGLGAAAAGDPRRAIVKAVIEAFQTRVWMRAEQRAGTALPPDTDFIAEIRDFHDHVRLYSGPGLIEHTRFLDAGGDRVAVGDLPAVPGDRPRQVLLGVLDRLAAQDVEVYLADATSPDVRAAGAVVARVLAPALVPLDAWFRARFLGVPRLRQRPVDLGLVPRPRRDEELTAYPHPFPDPELWMSASAEQHSGNLFDVVYGGSPPAYDDPAECFFEASKLHTRVLNCDLPGALALQRSPELQRFTQRGGRPNHSREPIPLPEPAPLAAELADVLAARRSADGFGPGELPMDVLAGLLVHSYGTTDPGGRLRRPTPSGGALYPIDLFVVAERVQGLAKGMYHYDPYRTGLTLVREVDFDALCQAILRPELARDCAAMIVLSATFWRSRFKYGQRGLRFCLMEAGHLMQSLLLLGTGYALAVRPIGGFLDDDAAAGMDFDGVNEAPLYLMLVGSKDSG